MIKPTHYDDDGYPIQWLRSIIPSNTLAALNGLAEDCISGEVLGADVEIRPHVFDETNARIRPDRIISQFQDDGSKVLVAFAGVQSNQFPRAIDLAKQFLDAGFMVAIGGFHVSGCLAMLKTLPPDIQAAKDMGITLFAGEAEEGRLGQVLRDADNGQLKPIYNHMNDLPSLELQPHPFLDLKLIGRVQNDFSSFDLGRGCPYQCSFCTIINVQGRKSRFRSADDLEAIVRKNAAQGIHKFFVTDDDLARNKRWEEFFDRLIELRKEGLGVELFVQVDMLCHRIDGFIEKACKAGVTRVFMGLENINPENLLAANKRQNKITEYRLMMQEWRQYGAALYAGYIIGFPGDTKDSVLRDVEIIKRELPLDVLEFFYLTPLPGSADHKKLAEGGVWMDPDMNKYDLFHRVTHHPTMSDDEWEDTYRAAWAAFFTDEHIETIGRRAVAQPVKGVNVDEVYEFFMSYQIEGVHPLEGGVLRRKYRRDRRPGLPLVNPLIFYPVHAFETITKLLRYALGYWKAHRMHKRIHARPDKRTYRDVSTTPPRTSDIDELSLLTETAGARGAIRRSKVQNAAKSGAGEVPMLDSA
ncbi:B12-binding domain-containing radical SAM protein [Candidatus Rhodobacter oscarellae]|nr:radical SAM protein [Candidatus Rhodobacter lobularis]